MLTCLSLFLSLFLSFFLSFVSFVSFLVFLACLTTGVYSNAVGPVTNNVFVGNILQDNVKSGITAGGYGHNPTKTSLHNVFIGNSGAGNGESAKKNKSKKKDKKNAHFFVVGRLDICLLPGHHSILWAQPNLLVTSKCKICLLTQPQHATKFPSTRTNKC